MPSIQLYSRVVRPCRVLCAATLLFVLVALFPSPARSASLEVIPIAAGYTTTYVSGVSSNGLVVVGSNRDSSGDYQAFSWVGGTMTGLGFLDAAHAYSRGSAVSSDGSVVVGYSKNSSGVMEAFRWVGGTMTGIGFLDAAHAYSRASAVSSDGSVVVGASNNGSGHEEAFRWVGGTMTGIGFLDATHTYSRANAVSSDGSVVVGTSHNDSGYEEAFRWVGGTMTGIGFLNPAHNNSTANAVSSDGSVVVGTSISGSDHEEAFRWVGGSIMGLGVLDDVTPFSRANAVSSDGSVVVGESVVNLVITAFRWTESTGMVSIASLLEDAGVDMTGYTLTAAVDVSADGSIIVGSDGNSGVSYIANVPRGGLITPDEFNQSLGTMGQVGPAVSGMGQLSMSRLGGVAGGQGMHFSVTGPGSGAGAGSGVGADTESGLSSGDEMPGRLDLWMVGSVGTNIELNGDDLGLHGGVGLSWTEGEWRFGGGLFGDTRDLDTSFGGNQDIQAVGPGAFVVYSPDGTGLEFRVAAIWQTVDLDLKRGYANGAGSATSSGDTDAEVFGLSGRAQWTRIVTDSLALTPFAEYTWQNTHIGGYSESGGPFPASYDSRDETSNSIRTGLRADVALFDKVGTWAWLAWDHRFEDKSSGLGGTATGLGAFSYAGSKLDQDWADAGVGASWDITERLSANSSLGVALGCDDDSVPDLTATMGFSYQLW